MMAIKTIKIIDTLMPLLIQLRRMSS